MSRSTATRAPHPGVVLAKVLRKHGMTANACAERLGLRPPRIYEICKGQKGVSPVMAARLARLFGGSAEEWLLLQARFDLAHVAREHAAELRRITPQPSQEVCHVE